MKTHALLLAGLVVGLANLTASPAAAQQRLERLLNIARNLRDSAPPETVQAFRQMHPAAVARSGRTPGLHLAETWHTAPLDRPLAIAVHGFYSNHVLAEPLLSGLPNDRVVKGHFEFASERSLDEAAALLSESLRRIAAQQPQRRVALVTHSLGGILARAVIEDPRLDPGNVSHLVMVAPPSHGSALANFGLDVQPFRQPGGEAAGIAPRLGRAALLQAVGPVAEQLRTDSAWLATLNARPRNPRVQYSIFLGTKGVVGTTAWTAIQAASDAVQRHERLSRLIGEKAVSQLASLAEVQDGLGDGVVAIERGKLEGVADVTLLPFRHSEPLSDLNNPVVRQLHQEIAARLLAPPALVSPAR